MAKGRKADSAAQAAQKAAAEEADALGDTRRGARAALLLSKSSARLNEVEGARTS